MVVKVNWIIKGMDWWGIFRGFGCVMIIVIMRKMASGFLCCFYDVGCASYGDIKNNNVH